MKKNCFPILLSLAFVLVACRSLPKSDEIRITQTDNLVNAASLTLMDTTWFTLMPGVSNIKVTMGETSTNIDLEKGTPASTLQVVRHGHINAEDSVHQKSQTEINKNLYKPTPKMQTFKLKDWPLIILAWCMAGGVVVLFLILVKLIRSVK